MCTTDMQQQDRSHVMRISNLVDMANDDDDDSLLSCAAFTLSSMHTLYYHRETPPLSQRNATTPPATPASPCNSNFSLSSSESSSSDIPPILFTTKASNSNAIRKRRRISEKPRAHKCDHCSAAFKTRHYLNSHMAVHSEERRFVCQLLGGECNASFTRHSDLRRHMRKVRHEDLARVALK
ncbi:hypothetical protein BJ741DRAFT_701879 [Chytriomyces cf. hyalinus JEL632]|nr:hypothetical protein BJ741DRAFT_701879 [Chytriomyces cf. hyalinus JEL632]